MVHSLSRAEKGQGLLELAIALPALLVLLLGLLDVGRAFWVLVTLKDAVSEGAQYAAAYPNQTTQILERAAESSHALMPLSPGMFSIDFVAPPTSGQPITVTASYTFTLLTPVINTIVPSGTLTLRATDTQVIY
jgi:Flp pilus assembly protein TadG